MEDILTFLKIMRQLSRYYDGQSCGGTDEDCRRMIQKGLKDRKVKFMMEQMEKSGCSIDPNKFIKPVYCQEKNYGFYGRNHGIKICYNYAKIQDEVTQTLMHELIHAYDDCRAKKLDWSNCYHHACSEIRAYRLSGDCHYVRVFFSDYSGKMRGHEPDCVRLGATQSLKSNRHCTEKMRKLAMDAVWDICYNDTKPYDRAP